MPRIAFWTTVGHVIDLWSMLIPLEGSLPGWTTAEQPTLVQELGVLFGIPLAIGLVIFALGMGSKLATSGRGDGVRPSQPLWLGDSVPDDALEGAAAPGSSGTVEQVTSELGGTSVRW